MSKITAIYKLVSPLSHIGSSEGIDSYLNTQYMVVNGKVEEVFVYSGNAIRGALRDAGAEYFLKDKAVNNNLFYLLFSGGSISGDQKTDIGKSREIRNKIPLISIFGGGIGTMILAGKLKVSDGYPICKETENFIPVTNTLSWRQLTSERSFTRFDDSKNFDKQKFMQEPPLEAKIKKQGEASTQMRYTCEVLNSGSEIYATIDTVNLTEIEMGCLISAMKQLCEYPYLGGKSNIGMGKFSVIYDLDGYGLMKLDNNGNLTMTDTATKYLEKYDSYIADIDVTKLEL